MLYAIRYQLGICTVVLSFLPSQRGQAAADKPTVPADDSNFVHIVHDIPVIQPAFTFRSSTSQSITGPILQLLDRTFALQTKTESRRRVEGTLLLLCLAEEALHAGVDFSQWSQADLETHAYYLLRKKHPEYARLTTTELGELLEKTAQELAAHIVDVPEEDPALESPAAVAEAAPATAFSYTAQTIQWLQTLLSRMPWLSVPGHTQPPAPSTQS